MPINGNGSKLKVVTNVAGNEVDNEDIHYRRSVYHGTSIEEIKRDQSLSEETSSVQQPTDEEPKLKRKSLQINTQTKDESQTDKALLQALLKDYKSRNIK